MPTYRIPVRYVFNGVYTVEADNLVDAMSHIKDDCVVHLAREFIQPLVMLIGILMFIPL